MNKKKMPRTAGHFLLILTLLIGTNKSFTQNLNNVNAEGPMGLQVNTLTGNLFMQRLDFELPARGFPLEGLFFYNSFDHATNVGFGNGWRMHYFIRLVKETNGDIRIIWGDGREDRYPVTGSTWQSPIGFFTTLTEYQAGSFRLVEKDGTQYFFDQVSKGGITRMIDPQGNGLNFTYTDTLLTGIKPGSNPGVNLVYNANGRLSELEDALASPARTWSYQYDVYGNLTTVVDPEGLSQQYSYLLNGPMKSIADRNTNVIDIIYFPDLTVSELIGCSKRMSLVYDNTTLSTVVTRHLEDGNDQITSYRYEKSDGGTWLKEINGNCCGYQMTFEYDARGNKTAETDAKGQRFGFTYDALGNLVTLTEPTGAVHRYTYTAVNNNIKSYTNPLGQVTEMVYDANGNVIEMREPENQTWLATYDAKGDLVQSTDPLGRIFTYTYDDQGSPATVSGPEGYTARLDFDVRGRLTSYTNSRSSQTTMEYDLLNRLKRITNPLNERLDIDLDQNGNATTITSPANKQIRVSYDAANRPVVLRDPLGQNTLLEWDAADNLRSYTDALGQRVELQYDKRNRLTTLKNTLGESMEMDYDKNGNLTAVQLPNGRKVTYTYDALNRLTTASDNLGAMGGWTYDLGGNRTVITMGTGGTITSLFDKQNRPTKVTDALGNAISFEYDASGRVVKFTDRMGHQNVYSHDALNRVVQMTDALGATLQQAYDSEGNVISQTDQNGHTTTYLYDPLNRRIRTTYPDGRYEARTYNSENQVTAIRQTDGTTLQLLYDNLNRLREKVYPDGRRFTYTYDALGRVISATNDAGMVQFTWDAMNRLLSETFDGRTVQYSYGPAGRSARTVYPDSTIVDMEFDIRNRLVAIRENGIELAAFTYNAFNRPVMRKLGNGVTTQYSYDIAGKLVAYNSGTLEQVQIAYDRSGNKTSTVNLLDAGKNESFTYDNRYQLREYRRGVAWAQQFTYDPVGNRLQSTRNGVTINYTPNNLNQLTSYTQGSQTTNLQWDQQGNLVFDGRFYKTYDIEKRLVKDSASPAVVISYQYDAMGRRIATTLPGHSYTLTYAGLKPIEERIGGQLRTRTVFAGTKQPLMINSGGENFYYQADDLGTITYLTSESGRVVERYAYDAYGERQILDSLSQILSNSQVGNRLGYTAQLHDSATGSLAFHFRHYLPGLGIFQQRDLIGYADGMGLYQYVHNNPANGIDLLGLKDCDEQNTTARDVIETAGGLTAGSGSSLEKLLKAYFKNALPIVDEVAAIAKDMKYVEKAIDILADAGNLDLANDLAEGWIELDDTKKALEGTKGFDKASKASQALKNLDKAGKLLGVIDALIKAEKFAETLVNPGSGYEGLSSQRKAGGDLALSLLGFTGVGGVFGLADFLQQRVTGKGMTDWAQEYGEVYGDQAVDQGMEEAMREYHRNNGTLKQYLNARKKVELNTARHRKPDCPQNGPGGSNRPNRLRYNPETGQTEVLAAFDPNEIIGPAGKPDKRWISVSDRLPYTVTYENDKSATAPARLVRITVPLHPNTDPSRFQLGGLGFNTLRFSIPAGNASWYQRLDCLDSLGLFVDLVAGYDVVNNQAFWQLQAIDPITGLPPSDPLKGMLLLQDSLNPEYGHGFVTFSLMPDNQSITEDSITEQATIVFDTNDPIPTNTEWNTVDAGAPTTLLDDPVADAALRIQLRWFGEDDPRGSGIASYSLYSSTDGINYSLVRSGITRTDTTLQGQPNGSYFYFVLATDLVGNTEALRPDAIRSITLSTVLPVTWLYFTGRNAGIDNHLQWATAKEQETSHFEVERSLDGIKFKKIGQVAAAGNRNSTSTYQFTDAGIDQLGSKLMYYRLRQVDRSGMVNVSSTIALSYHPANQKRSLVYPNPASQWVTVALGDAKLIGTRATLYDEQGRLLQTIPITQMQQRVNLGNYTNGIYLIRMSNGETMKVMKQ